MNAEITNTPLPITALVISTSLVANILPTISLPMALQGIIQKFNMSVGFHVSITLLCELCSYQIWEGAVSAESPSLPPILLYITSRFAYIYETPFFVDLFRMRSHSNFSVLQIRSADKLFFGLNVLLPYSSYCFPYFLLYENCLFFLSLKISNDACPLIACNPLLLS